MTTDSTGEHRPTAVPEPGTGTAAWAECRLRDSAYSALRSVRCECLAGVLSLRGRVPSYYLKQLAQSLVAGAPGAGQIENRLEVVAPGSMAEGHA